MHWNEYKCNEYARVYDRFHDKNIYPVRNDTVHIVVFLL